MRRTLAMVMAGGMALCAGGCAASSQEAYEFAERCIGMREYETAGEYFMQLGEYRDSAEYLLYADALLAMEKGDYALARANLEQIIPFKSSERYLLCLDAMELEKDEQYDEALELYRELGTFAGCDERAARLQAEIPEKEREACRDMMEDGDYAAALERLRQMDKSTETAKMIAECEAAQRKAVYKEACELHEKGETEAAIRSFEGLGDMLDVPARLAACRSELYLETIAQEINLETIPAMIAAYELLGDYLDSADRLMELRVRANCAEEIRTSESGYIRLGIVKDETDGSEEPLLWRIESENDGILQIACDEVQDREILWNEKERRILVKESERMGGIRPVYNLHDAEGKLTANCVPVFTDHSSQRIVQIDISNAPFIAGDGTAEQPYVIEK